MNKLLSVGSIALDSIYTPFGFIERTMGGAVSYIGLSAAIFDVEQAVVGVVGYDYPKEYLDALADREIDISQVQVSTERTLFWSAKYHTDMNARQTLETQLNAFAGFRPVVPAHFTDARFVMLGNMEPSLQLEVLQQLTAEHKFVALDTMNYWIERTPQELHRIISMVDLLCINDEEARQLSGEYSLVRAAHQIMRLGVPYLIIKKGEHGALLFHKDEVFFAPALPLDEVFDPTGAGDAFAGGIMGYLAKSGDVSFENMKNALIYGATIASFCVESFGTKRLLALTKDEVLRRLLEFKSLTQFEIKIA